ncbi:PREDICTED: galactoside 2-alpha-L-fucosyltransferase 2 [Myotis davidii]|uniref:L-Fucosyltransferase n=1 Tax=Myotis davidii TaxID=225400 RepID=L5LIQ1_MYODS|nr:PREDICTED: galactoside 2-alpha-L-fucosyltransferase 2 [Myotis davidii]ELK25493.1 Galactoside 2-alpha-L-fucosyltransferase 2 [Myotis davidii]
MPSTQGPFFFPMAHFVLFVFTASTIFHLQQRLVKIQPPLAAQRLEPEETEDNASSALSAPSALSTPSTLSTSSSTSSTSSAPRGMWTINAIGRLGNQMGEYATLYALAKMNGRPAFIPAEMHSSLAPIFRISLPVLHGATASRIPWHNYHLNDWMEEQYRHLPWEYVRLTGYPCSWTFYHHLRPEILREFTLHDHVREAAQRFLRGLQATRAPQLTFVGVHVRRGDYVRVMPRVWKGVLADRGYLQQALDRFRARHPAPVFVVTSNGMAWCRENIDASRGDVVFAGDGVEGSPAKDFALLTQCNHTVMTIGTFGIWAAYLAGGETIYLANYTLPDSPFLKVFKPEAAFLPEWFGIAADLSPLLKP